MGMKRYAAAVAIALEATAIAFLFVKYFVPDTDCISNQTITNGLEDCNVTIGDFEWTVIITSEHSQCSGALIHPNYVLTAGKLLQHDM